MEGWKDGRVEGWKDGRMEGWKDGRMEGWKDGRMEGWKDGRVEGWKDGRMRRLEGADAAGGGAYASGNTDRSEGAGKLCQRSLVGERSESLSGEAPPAYAGGGGAEPQ